MAGNELIHVIKSNLQPLQGWKGKTMNRSRKIVAGKQKIVFLILIVTGLMVITPSFAGEFVAVKEMQPAPAVISVGPGFPEDDHYGTLDEINSKGAIIGDLSYKFASSILFLSASGKPVSSLKAKIGSIVHFQVNSKRKLIAMWPDP